MWARLISGSVPSGLGLRVQRLEAGPAGVQCSASSRLGPMLIVLRFPWACMRPVHTRLRGSGNGKLTILGGEPTTHPNYVDSVRSARRLGYEHVITTTNGQVIALRKFRQLGPDDGYHDSQRASSASSLS